MILEKSFALEMTESAECMSICIYTYGVWHDRGFYRQINADYTDPFDKLRTGSHECAQSERTQARKWVNEWMGGWVDA